MIDKKFSIENSVVFAQYWPTSSSVDTSSADTRTEKTKKEHLKVIALHGWCDNSASFNALATKLNADVLAIDLPGHGKSYHRQEKGSYVIWQDIYDIYAIAKQMEWSSFALIGHSRGAMIASLFASAFPDMVSHLALIEGFLPPPQEVDDMPEHLAHAVKSKESLLRNIKNYYPTFEAAIKARENGLFKLPYSDALALANRGVEQNDKGYYWQYDTLLKAPSEIKLTRDILVAFLSKIKIPVELIVAEKGLMPGFEKLLTDFSAYLTLKQHLLPGGHHLHMSEQVDEIAVIFNQYFQ